MSVRMNQTTAMRMHSASTPRGISPAPAILDTLEMESTVQVRCSFISIQNNVFGKSKICILSHSIYTMYMYTYSPACMGSADINECELETYPCSPNANCTDTDGSFSCTCREGFEGDGFNCTGMYNKVLHKHSCVLK